LIKPLITRSKFSIISYNLIVTRSDLSETKDPCKIHAQVPSAYIKLRPFSSETISGGGGAGVIRAEAEEVGEQ
jgi:hypothetical protein